MPALKNSPKNNQKRLMTLYFLGLLLAVSTALPAYIQSNFLRQFVSLNTVSLFFMTANLATVAAILVFPKFIKELTNYFLAKIVLIVYASSLLGLALATNAGLALISIILFSVASNLIWINMDVLVESFSANASTGKTRTTYFTFINTGWILSPLLTTYLIGKGEYTLSFLIAGFLVIPVFLIFLFQAKNLKDKIKYREVGVITSLKNIWAKKNTRGIFFVAFLLQLFYSTAVIYVPLYLFQNLGMDWKALGPIFSVMLIPFIILEIPAGLIADKYIGEKEIMSIGFIILAIALFLFYYISVPNAWIWMAVLFFSRVGAALVEAMRETYFFKTVSAEDVSYINIFRLTAPMAYIIGPGISILVFMFWPLNYLFLVMSIIMLFGLGFSLSLKDTK
ncbi:MAG: MFS transporter [Candidatus Falkowbacteria bacterium]|nr:MFS transporter [Candidatus Falkowbacteria bacterium]